MKTIALGVLGLCLTGCLAELGEGDGTDDIVQRSEALAGYVLVTAETAVNTTAVKDVTASCPPGTVAYGAGYAALNSADGVHRAELRHFVPGPDGTTWRARAHGVIRGSTLWKLRLVVTCGAKPEGYTILTADSTLSTASKKSVVPACSTQKSPPVRALGGGFAALDAADAILDGDLVRFGATTASWEISAKTLTAGASWKLRGYAICAKTTALPGHQVILSEAPYTVDTGVAPTINARCGRGQLAVAAGARLLSDTNTDLELHGVYSVPVTGGWTSTGVRVPPTQKSLAPRAFEQSTICLN